MTTSGNFAVKVSVSGVDQATKELDKINKQLAAAQAPAKAYEKAMKRYEDLSGITKQREALKKADEAHRLSVTKTLQSVNSLGESLMGVASTALKASAAVLGLGALGSVAEGFALAKSFGQSSLGLANMSRNLSITTDQLLNLHNAAEKVGVSSSDMDSAFHAAGQVLQDSVAGRNPAAYAFMKGVLHIDPSQKAFLAKTFAEQSQDIFKAISKITDPRLQENALNIFGAGALLPIVQNLDKYNAALQQTEHDSRANTQEGLKLYDSFTSLSQASGQLGRDIIDVLSPALTPFIGNVTDLAHAIDDWITKNKTLIDQKLDEWLKPVDEGIEKFMTWLKTADVGKVAGEVKLLGTAFLAIATIPIATTFLGIASSLTQIAIGLTTVAPELTAFAAAAFAIYEGWNKASEAYDSYERKQDKIRESEERDYEHNQEHGIKVPKWGARFGGTAKGPIYKNHNPTNLSAYPGQPFATGSNGRWASYNNDAAGFAGGLYQMLLDQSKGYNTIAKEIVHRSPPNENDTQSIINYVSSSMHMDPNAPLNLYDPDIAKKFLIADSKRETGIDANPDDVATGVSQALAIAQSHNISGNINANININGAPQGSTATATATGSAFQGPPNLRISMAGY